MLTLADLAVLTPEALDDLYARTPLLPLPRGVFDGHVLTRLATPGARRTFYRLAQWVGFELVTWGIDFDHARWFFVHHRARSGHFTTHPGASRWRPTEAHGLRYGLSRLPWVGRGLYDEVKPLNDSLVLGIGGVNAERGEGDHFYFALTRRPR